MCDRRTDGQNYDSQDRASIAASRGKNWACRRLFYPKMNLSLKLHRKTTLSSKAAREDINVGQSNYTSMTWAGERQRDRPSRRVFRAGKQLCRYPYVRKFTIVLQNFAVFEVEVCLSVSELNKVLCNIRLVCSYRMQLIFRLISAE